MKPENKHIHCAWLCWAIAAAIAVTFLSGCERVTEYKCSNEQIEAMKPQLDFCDRMSDGDMVMRVNCYDKVQRAHCEVAREFQRTEIIKEDK